MIGAVKSNPQSTGKTDQWLRRSNKKAALGPNRSSTAGRLPILFESTLAGSLSRSMPLVRHLSSEPLIATPKGADWVKALTPKDRLPSWSVD